MTCPRALALLFFYRIMSSKESELKNLNVMKALKPLSVEKMKSLMFYLGVPVNDLDDIQLIMNDAHSQKVQFVQKWLDVDADASWEKLVSGLREINMQSLALDIISAHILKTNAAHTFTPLISATVSSITCTSPGIVDQDRIEMVRAEIDNLEDQFFELKSDTRSSLSNKENEDKKFLGTFRDFLLNLPVAKRVIHAKFFLRNEDEILEAKNIEKLFAILGRYCNYSNYDIIVLIIKKFGNGDLRVRMLKYCDSIKKFEVSTTAAVYLKAISANPDGEICKGFTRMALKINKSTSDCTLHEIRKLKESMAENASVHSYSVYVESLAESSVLVVLRVHPACARQLYAAMTPDFTYLYNLMDVKLLENGKHSSLFLCCHKLSTNIYITRASLIVLLFISVTPKFDSHLPCIEGRTTEDDHHEEEKATEDDHHEGERTTDDNHHEGERTTDDNHHEGERTTDDNHHEGERTTEDNHHEKIQCSSPTPPISEFA